jgi:hypothetical protein
MALPGILLSLWPSRLIGASTIRFAGIERTIRPQKAALLSGNTALLCVAALISTAVPPSQAGPPSQSAESRNHPEILFVQAGFVKVGRLSERFPQGSRIVRLKEGSTKPANLTPNFFGAADPRISFDGSKVLFAGKKDAAATWQIWEMNTDGTGQRQVTHCDGNCLAPAYLPRDAIAFSGEVQDAGGSRAYQIYFGKLDGSDMHPITFGPGDYELETVLQNGLILVSARSPLQARGKSESSRNLYTLRHDGSALAAFRCDHRQAVIRGQAEELDDGSVVFVKNKVLDSEAGGDLAAIRRGAMHNSTLGPMSALFWSPRQLEADRLIVARRAPTPRSAGKFDLYSFDFIHGKFQAPIYEDSELSSIEAVPVAAHPAPRWYWSTLSLETKVGYFICLDASLSVDAPKGRLSPQPSAVRVLALDPSTRMENRLGEAPIEQDGSFYIAVPPDRPLRFELLNADGKVVREQHSWIWARPGEEHGCVGCHEDRAVAPENRWPLVLRRFDTPTCLGVQAPLEAAH